MSELLIFGGTTEGRELAEFCSGKHIRADICVTTDYGAALLPDGVSIHTGRLNVVQMNLLMARLGTKLAVDATHPYAAEATNNIRSACDTAGVSYIRLIRAQADAQGETVPDLPALVERLNAHDGVIFSTLGSKSLDALTGVQNFSERLWLRLLPADGMYERCEQLGFPAAHIFWGKGPFTAEENAAHIRLSGASLLVTKESGAAGGYPEKLEAAKCCGIRTLTLLREPEKGLSLREVMELLEGTFKNPAINEHSAQIV